MKQLTITITILSLILMSTVSAQEAAPSRISNLPGIQMPFHRCRTACDCKFPCTKGHAICHDKVCGCLDHPLHHPPICTLT